MSQSGSRHSVEIREDVVYLEFFGACETTDMARILACIDAAMAAQPPACFVIADVSKLTTVTPETRKLAAKWPNRNRLRAVAVHGASPLIRGLIQLLSNALALFAKRPVELRFFAGPREAVAWMNERRQTLANVNW